MIRTTLYSSIIGLTSIGMIFKFLHWNGAEVLIVAAFIAIVVAMLEYFIKNFKSSSTLQFFTPILGISFVLGILFKIMSYPYANEMLLFSVPSISFVYINHAFKIRKSVYAILPLIFSVFFFMVLLRVLHLPEPKYLLYGSYFVFATLVPIFIFISAKNIKVSNNKIGDNFLVISILSLFLCLIEFKIKFYPILFGSEDEWMYSYVLKIILVMGILLFAVKTLLIKKLKEKHKLDHMLLQCIGGSYMILMVILGLVKAY